MDADNSASNPGLGSLLTPDDLLAMPAPRRRAGAESVQALADSMRRAANTQGARRFALALGVLLSLSGVVWAYFEFRTRPIPNYASDDIEDVLDYTLLSEDFNRLPIDKRLALIKDMVARLKGMNSGDSELMAAFAAGISGKAREQLQRNIEKMGVDLWDSFAEKYAGVKAEQREGYLDDAFIEFTRMMEDVGGFQSDKSDKDRVSDAKSQAQRDMENARKGDQGMDRTRITRFMKTIDDRGGKLAQPAQKARMARFSRDMVRHLRGQDIDTGKPKDGGGGGGDAPAAPAPGGG